MTLTFGIATRPTGAFGATRGMLTTTSAMTRQAGTRKASAGRTRTTSTATSRPGRQASKAAAWAPRSARITGAPPRARGTLLAGQTPVPPAAMAAPGFSQSVVYSSDGTLIGRFGTTDRQMLNYDQIPQTVINAMLAAEDRNFFNEGGVSPTGIVRAAYSDLTGGNGSLQGGSPLTQEFVRPYSTGIGTQQTASRKIN